MSWAGFSDADLEKLKRGKDSNESKPTKKVSSLSGSKSPKFQKAKNERKSHISTSLSSDGLLPKGQRLSQQKESDSASSSLVIKIPRDQLVMPPVESPKQHEDKHSPVDQVTIKQEVDEVPQEINDEEALSREMGNLEKFREQQKMIEEANKQRKALLSKTLSERQKRARQEAAKLAHIQKELQLLDNRLTADVTVIRSRIELASRDFLEAQKRYDRAEREFVDAKIDLQKKSEMKEQLTEHLYTIIHQNEVRKAGKLSELMGELEMEAKEDGVQLPELPPLATFNTITTLQALQSPKSPSDILSSLHKHMKDMTSSSSEAAESVSSQDGKREGKTTDENDENENPVNLTCPISKEKERNKSLTEKGHSDTLVKEGNSKTESENGELTESDSNSKNLSNSRENHIDSIQSVEGEKEKSADSEILNESVSRQLETTGDMCPGESSASGSISPNVTLDSNIQIKKEIID